MKVLFKSQTISGVKIPFVISCNCKSNYFLIVFVNIFKKKYQDKHVADDDDLITSFILQGKCTLEGVGPETCFKLLLAPVEHDRDSFKIYCCCFFLVLFLHYHYYLFYCTLV